MRARTRSTAWLIVAALIAAAMLAAVHAVETFGHYPPCELCLHQREVLWTVLALAALGVALGRVQRLAPRVAVVAVGVAFAVGAVLAAYHAGVEWKWWPGPAACTAPRGGPVSAAAIGAILDGIVKTHLVRCDEAAFRIGPLSLAGWNALASAALAIASFAPLIGRDRR